jgi:hypothetical protein
MGGGDPMSWPSRSLDLTPYIFFGGILEVEVYGAIGYINSVKTLEQDYHSYWNHNIEIFERIWVGFQYLQHYKK